MVFRLNYVCPGNAAPSVERLPFPTTVHCRAQVIITILDALDGMKTSSSKAAEVSNLPD